MAKSNRRGSNEINASSMADIAFLLLIFFLVTTTMDIDKGITIKLPPMPEPDQELLDIKLNKRNTWDVLINANDRLLVKGKPMNIQELKVETKRFLSNNGADANLSVSPQKAVVSLKNDRGTSYDMYIQVQNELKAAYNELREEESEKTFGKSFADLPKADQKKIRKMYPLRLSEAEPENTQLEN